ncbi:MAG: diaminobutyrate--2-oxoglutarate transaminase [Faecalibacillus sp.]
MQKEEVFNKYESNVRSYCRSFPTVFKTAKNSIMTDSNHQQYIDFFCGAGALNYGHNNDYIKEKVIEYLNKDGICHALDMMTECKADFIQFFEEKILKPRNLDYKIMFPGPTGTNSVEAALKLARKYTKRTTVWALMGAFHGMTLGSLALTSDKNSRKGAGVNLNYVTHIPAPYMFKNFDILDYMKQLIEDDHSGIEKPAAIILETTQAEGGIYVLSNDFLKAVREFCDYYDILMIVDDIQVGCGRTGTFFSFERANIIPDIICLSKSIGGMGLPFALTLCKPEIDCFEPGEHNGTFRGNQLAMVASKASLEFLIENNVLDMVNKREQIIEVFLNKLSTKYPVSIRGIGCIWGIDTKNGQISKAIMQTCFQNNLILERAGRNDSVIKIMPSLIIEEDLLLDGLHILENAIEKVYNEKNTL